MPMYFDDCNDEIVKMVRVGVQVMGIDITKNDLIVDYDYIDYEDECLGYCEHWNKDEDNEVSGQSISLSRRIHDSNTDMATVIAHELVHVKQYQDGRLSDQGPMQIGWCGETYIFDAVNYHKQPWEAEAYSKQDFWATKIRNRINDLH